MSNCVITAAGGVSKPEYSLLATIANNDTAYKNIDLSLYDEIVFMIKFHYSNTSDHCVAYARYRVSELLFIISENIKNLDGLYSLQAWHTTNTNSQRLRLHLNMKTISNWQLAYEAASYGFETIKIYGIKY